MNIGKSTGRRTRQTGSKRLNRTRPISFRVAPESLRNIDAMAAAAGLDRSDWIATCLDAVSRRGLSPLAIASEAEVADVRAGAVNNANAGLLLRYALHQLDRARVTARRRALARDALRHCHAILGATVRRIW